MRPKRKRGRPPKLPGEEFNYGPIRKGPMRGMVREAPPGEPAFYGLVSAICLQAAWRDHASHSIYSWDERTRAKLTFIRYSPVARQLARLKGKAA